jgi:hypothetical protein
MRDPDYRPAAADEAAAQQPEEPPDVTRDTRAFTAAIRTRIFAFLRSWSIGRDAAALEVVDSRSEAEDGPWTEERLRAAREAHRVEHGGLRLDPEARNLRHTHVEPSEDGKRWRVQQMLVDAEGINDWVMELDVDLDASRAADEPVLQLLRLESLV